MGIESEYDPLAGVCAEARDSVQQRQRGWWRRRCRWFSRPAQELDVSFFLHLWDLPAPVETFQALARLDLADQLSLSLSLSLPACNPLHTRSKIETPSGALADGIDFSAMDAFMTSILSILSREGALIARVFPPQADVLLYFLERVANDVVSEYITSLLAAAQPLRHPLFLLATAATFGQVYRLVDCVLEIRADSSPSSSSADSEDPTRPAVVGGGGGPPPPQQQLPLVTKERAEDVVFRMFEPLMDDYLAEEGEWIREVLEGICDEWDRKVSRILFSFCLFLRTAERLMVLWF